jgi:hypothetical protein
VGVGVAAAFAWVEKNKTAIPTIEWRMRSILSQKSWAFTSGGLLAASEGESLYFLINLGEEAEALDSTKDSELGSDSGFRLVPVRA